MPGTDGRPPLKNSAVSWGNWMRKQFKETITDLATQDASIILIFGDVSVYMFKDFSEKYPERFYNMGLCENTLISVAGGLSSQGFTPFVHTIAPFVTERSYEQIKLDLCYNNFPANIVTCGASFDYAWDGATHHCYTDLAILRLLPNIEVIQPGSRKELDVLLRSQYKNDNPTYFRLSDHPHNFDIPTRFGEGVVLKDVGSNVSIITAGPLLANVFEACRDLHVNIVYFHTIKPIDEKLVNKFKTTNILIVHDAFGLFEAVSALPDVSASYYGIADDFGSCYGEVYDVRDQFGLDVKGIREKVRKLSR